jgi:hypothetical protein
MRTLFKSWDIVHEMKLSTLIGLEWELHVPMILSVIEHYEPK